jgi:hypothetical protein
MEFIAIKGEPVTYQNLTIEDIIAWCQENDEVMWLKAKVKEKRVRKVYPKKEGTNKADRTAAPVGTKTTKISFIELKHDFAEKFCPDILPVAKPKKKSMLDLIDAL